MVTEKHDTLASLIAAAGKDKAEILETPVAYYYRLFKDGNCTHIHLFYKP